MTSKKDIVSSHIFIFPFKWDCISDSHKLNSTINKRINTEKIEQILLEKWKRETTYTEINNDTDYNTYSYFYDNARQAIYGNEDYILDEKSFKVKILNATYGAFKSKKKKTINKVVKCFKYKNLSDNDKYIIEIEKQIDTDAKKEIKPYELKIKDIKLKIYDTGVANLVYFLENYNENTTQEDILRINDYGRRIYPQFLPISKAQNSFLAKKITLSINRDKTIDEDFNYAAKENPNRISNTIMKLLGENFICNKKDLQKGKFFIAPIIDDRMFVICYYNNNRYSRILAKYNKDECFKNDFWYQYVFIDNGGATCQDEKMKKELLLKSTYTRWKDCGTLFGISRYSFVLLCDESQFSKDVLFNHINTVYYEMIVLALAQRTSILRFSDETSRIANFKNKNIAKQIKKLQKYYISFVNTIYFREVTAQEQGIELYDKLIEFMKIENEIKRLDEEIDEIQRYITLDNNESTNKLINLITCVGLSVSVMGVVATTYTVMPQALKWILIFGISTSIVVFIIEKLIKGRR